MPEIHATAIIEEGATLAGDVQVGPYCFVGRQVTLGPGCVLHQGAIIQGRATLGARNHVFPYAVLGSVPQDKKYQGEETRLEVGDDNVFREHVTVNIGTEGGGGATRVGHGNLLMAGVHVGHDCLIGDQCVLAQATGLAGHVVIEDFAILGGQTGIHQFVRVGRHCITSGGAKVGKDVPPFTIAQGYPARLRGVNLVGLKRRGFTDATVQALKQVYRAVFREQDAPFEELLERARHEFGGSHEARQFLDFLAAAQSSDRGFLRPSRGEDEGQVDALEVPSRV